MKFPPLPTVEEMTTDQKKKCVITNEKFSYVMKVDGETINFTRYHIAQYFARHYKECGYEVVVIL